MNLPNRLTILRMILVPLFLLFLVPIGGDHAFTQFIFTYAGRAIALIVFIVASLTDLFDGYLARKLGLVSTFGKFLDPIADKLLVIAGFAAFVELGRVSTFVLMIIVAREFLVTGIRLLAAERGTVIAANWFGKIKAVLQMITLIILMFEPIVLRSESQPGGFMEYRGVLVHITDVLIGVTVVITLLSGFEYWRKNRSVFTAQNK